jgi:acyl-CoA reductase-like NAD-dependent aldehyde dehydrogenase
MTQFKNFIGGEWVDGNDFAANVNPSDTSDVIGQFAQASADQTQKAIAAARSAFRTWSLSTPQQRFDLLDQVGSTILARKNELGKLLAREEGKTLAEAVGEVGRAGQIFKFFAGEALRVGGEIVPSVRPQKI